jgi:acetyl-CoA C-acetyltransferase
VSIVSIAGIGQTKGGEHWNLSLCDLAVEAGRAAMEDAPALKPQAVIVGNMMAGRLNGQEALGAMLAEGLGLRGMECLRVEAACASSAAAVRVGSSMIASGQSNCVLLVGVEK